MADKFKYIEESEFAKDLLINAFLSTSLASGSSPLSL